MPKVSKSERVGNEEGMGIDQTCLLTCEKRKQQPFNGHLSGTTRVGQYQKKHSPAHIHPGQRTSIITFLHLQRSMASSLREEESLFKLLF